MMTSLVFSIALLQAAGPPSAGPEASRTGEIRGRVTDKESGRPIARASVLLATLDNSERRAGRTDAAGVFRIAGLAPGSYTGLVGPGEFRATHLTGSLGSGSLKGGRIDLKAGEVREVDTVLTRARAISVRIVDEWGDPVSGVRVTVHSATTRRTAQVSFLRSTDDLGRLRVSGLPSGRYVVCAERHSNISQVRQGAGRAREGLLRTCYPSAPDEAEALAVQVDGSDAGELEIRMRSGRTFTISGTVLDAAGAPASNPLIMLTQFRVNGSGGTSITAGADGRFTLTNVHAGEYAIEASVGGPHRPDQRRPLEAGVLPIRVEGSDLDNVIVPMTQAVSVPGLVRLEDPNTVLPRAAASGLSILARLADGRLSGTSLGIATVGEDGRFELTGISGRRTLDVSGVQQPWYVKSILYAGNEIIDEPLEIKAGAEPARLEVILSDRGAAVTGRVLDDRGQPAAGARVVMFSADSSRQALTATSASVAGAFRIGPVRKGGYLIVALPPSSPMVETGQWDRIDRLSSVAERLTLGEEDRRVLDLHVVTER